MKTHISLTSNLTISCLDIIKNFGKTQKRKVFLVPLYPSNTSMYPPWFLTQKLNFIFPTNSTWPNLLAYFWKKKFFQLICTDKTYKMVCGNLLKYMGLEIFNSRWFFSSEKLFFTMKLLIKLDRQKIKKIPHTILETIISQIIL